MLLICSNADVSPIASKNSMKDTGRTTKNSTLPTGKLSFVLNIVSNKDPAAITDPKKMEEAWTTITDLAIKMRGGSPEKISDDVATMVDSIVAMNKVFKDNKYDLLGMSKKPEVREQLAKISGDEKVAIASNRYNKFMEDNCPPLE